MNGRWTEVRIADKKTDLYDPPGKPRFAVLHLHGVGMESLRDRPAYTRVLDELQLACACPLGMRSWWGDRLCEEFDPQLTPERFLLEHVAPALRERWALPERAIGLHGISMGGQGALRLAFKHPLKFPAVAGISSALDYHEIYGQGYSIDAMYDSKEQCRQDTALMHIHPSQYPPHIFFCIDPDDAPWYRGNDRLHEKLSALGVSHTMDLTTRAGGHSWQYFEHMARPTLRFLHDGLVHESRRLL
jgi:S-formylglutathione hydrolase